MPLNEDMEQPPKAGAAPSDDALTVLINKVIDSNPTRFKGKDGDSATNVQVATSVKAVIDANPDQFKGKPGDKGEPGTVPFTTRITTATDGTGTITFPANRFSSVPKFVDAKAITPLNDTNSYVIDILTVTTTGATVRARKLNGTAVNIVVGGVVKVTDVPSVALTVQIIAYD
ncbi:hypothetical protein ACFSGI_08960 [Paenibacillus nicotianae]|uniref:Collagen triple helix repeat-containing protein n=1 Tax=Paenibacillus nicotianae TaxID=1526551 RepID=A0ABW4UUG6_9BACL